MVFKQPEVLYALFLLVIPVLVHLFQLRKFRKEKFTNVEFLKKAALQTRKSAQIKKWLILFTRLFLFASLILAFAQPYFEISKVIKNGEDMVIYLDNSFSMQAKGKNGVLLKRSIQELLENLPKENGFSLFTNTKVFKNTNLKLLRKDLQKLSYSPTQLDWKTVQLKAEDLFSELPNTRKTFIAISDFQGMKEDEISALKGTQTVLIPQKPESINNISVDTAFISSKSLDETHLSVRINATGKPNKNIAVAIYNGTNLIAKKTVVLKERTATTTFLLPSQPILNGKISIEDAGLSFDNQLYFSINKTNPIQIVAINPSKDSFLNRIYNAPDFEFQAVPEHKIDFNILMEANLIVLNELSEIPVSLSTTLKKLLSENVFLIVIPSEEANLRNYNLFFKNHNLPGFDKKMDQEKLITKISYQQPLFQSVFDEKVENFEYPKVHSYFRIDAQVTPVLSFEGGAPFLFRDENIFVFSAPLNQENSNFKNSPLIVPTLYNIGNLSLKSSQLYYTLGKTSEIDVKFELGQDEILKMHGAGATFIPKQRSFKNKITLTFDENPEEHGAYTIKKDSIQLTTLSFNVNRKESQLNTNEISASEAISIESSISSIFQEIQSKNEKNGLWKWFVTFALFFLLLEMLILKFFK